MKKFGHVILWVDYFNSNLSRREGRRVPRDMAVSNPTLEELEEAARRIGLQPHSSPARIPRRNWVDSGYIMVKKTAPKQRMLLEVAKHLAQVRGERYGQGKAKA
jgi:signal recognition particle subunit SRP19